MSVRRRYNIKDYPPLGMPTRLPKLITVESSEDWNEDYELVVSYNGYDSRIDEAVSKIAGLTRYDTGYSLLGKDKGMRDLQFFCGTNRHLARRAAARLHKADYFNALRIRISYPVMRDGEDSFTEWYSWDGKLLERIKHRKLAPRVIRVNPKRKHRRVAA